MALDRVHVSLSSYAWFLENLRERKFIKKILLYAFCIF